MKTKHRNSARAKRQTRCDPRGGAAFICSLLPYSNEQLTSINLNVRMSFEAMRTGHGTPQDYRHLVDAASAVMLRTREYEDEHQAAALAAIRALERVGNRYAATGMWGFDGPALQEVSAMLDMHEYLLENGSPREMSIALATAQKLGAKK